MFSNKCFLFQANQDRILIPPSADWDQRPLIEEVFLFFMLKYISLRKRNRLSKCMEIYSGCFEEERPGFEPFKALGMGSTGENVAPSFVKKPQLRQEDDGNRLIFECKLAGRYISNKFANLDNYFFQFGQIHFAIKSMIYFSFKR